MHLIRSSHLLLFALFVFIVNTKSVIFADNRNFCIEQERQILLKIKQDLLDEFNHLSSWREDDDDDCCNWRGIQCSNTTSNIITLDLRDLPLRGKINPSLLQLQHLNYLDLSSNDFQGTQFPHFNGSLTQLSYLNVSNSGFTATLSNQLRNLSNLQYLDLSYNNFSSVETLQWLFHLPNLKSLDLSGNNLNKIRNWLRIVNELPHLKILRLRSCNLSDIAELSDFPQNSSFSLSVLDLSFNNLSSLVFKCLQNMTSLENINLSSNELEGTIPNFFGDFCSLHTLDLSQNRLTGEVPVVFENLSGCAEKSLQILELEMNQLHGSLPDFTRFSALRELILYTNQMNGSFPEKFSRVSGLIELDAGDNRIEGSFPDLSMFPSLKKLCVVYNRLNGTISESIGGLSQLEYLWVSHNSFQGIITETHFRNLSQLKQVYFNHNNLTVKFNSDWLPPFQLDIIGFSACILGPHFPNWLRTQNNYSVLDISDAEISGPLPDWFWDLPLRLFHLNISYNLLSGRVPDLSLKFDGSPGIDLSSNLFEGPLPLLPSNSSSLNLSRNKFSGSISSVCQIINESVNFLDLSDNLLSGDVPDSCFINGKQLIVLNLAANNLSGKIPSSVGSLSFLQTFTLRNNSFSGEIPSSLRNVTRLRFFDLSYNRLSGSIPAWIGEQQALVFLSLQSNIFHGSIPVQLCWLQNILLLDLSLNNISGTIPHCLGNFTLMRKEKQSVENTYYYIYPSSSGVRDFEGRYYDSALVGWKGQVYEYQKNLQLLRIINLAGNKLSGEIPRAITDLVALVGINISRNDLIGVIPEDIGRLKNLQDLDLSGNRLSGVVPESMAELNFLSQLNLSYNNLSGRIPTSTQLQSFDASSYDGNVGICGFPVTQKCPGDDRFGPTNDESKDTEEDDDEEDGDEFMQWFYVGMGCGFSVGYGAVLLLLLPSLRFTCFKFLQKVQKRLFVMPRIEPIL